MGAPTTRALVRQELRRARVALERYRSHMVASLRLLEGQELPPEIVEGFEALESLSGAVAEMHELLYRRF